MLDGLHSKNQIIEKTREFHGSQFLDNSQILSNEEKRNIYDIYGKEGLEAGFELGEPLRSSRDLKDEYEKFKSQRVSFPMTFKTDKWLNDATEG